MTTVILMEPGQLRNLIEDLQAAQRTPATRTVALIISQQAIEVHNAAFTFPQEASFYVGPICTLGFSGSLQDIQRQLGRREQVN